jgi:hypothetical protein
LIFIQTTVDDQQDRSQNTNEPADLGLSPRVSGLLRPSGRQDLNLRPLDPQHCARAPPLDALRYSRPANAALGVGLYFMPSVRHIPHRQDRCRATLSRRCPVTNTHPFMPAGIAPRSASRRQRREHSVPEGPIRDRGCMRRQRPIRSAITRTSWSRRMTPFHSVDHAAPDLLQIPRALSTWNGETRSTSEPVLPGRRPIHQYSTSVELRGFEPLTPTLSVQKGQCTLPATLRYHHVRPVVTKAAQCSRTQ